MLEGNHLPSDVKEVFRILEHATGSTDCVFLNCLTFLPQYDRPHTVKEKLLVGYKGGLPVYCYFFPSMSVGSGYLEFKIDNTASTLLIGSFDFIPLLSSIETSKTVSLGIVVLRAFIKACFILKGSTTGIPVNVNSLISDGLPSAFRLVMESYDPNREQFATENRQAIKTLPIPKKGSMLETQTGGCIIRDQKQHTPKKSGTYGMFGGTVTPTKVRRYTLRSRSNRRRIVDSSDSESEYENVRAQSSSSETEAGPAGQYAHGKPVSDQNDITREIERVDVAKNHELLNPERKNTDDGHRITPQMSGPALRKSQTSASDRTVPSYGHAQSAAIREDLLSSYIDEHTKEKRVMQEMTETKKEQKSSEEQLQTLKAELLQLEQRVEEQTNVVSGYKRKLEESDAELSGLAKRMKELKEQMTGTEGFEVAMRITKM